MSEEIINQTAKVMKRETNNNVSKDDTLTYGSSSEHKDTMDYDEIGKECDFSDNDSQEENEIFKDCDNGAQQNSNADNNDNDSDRLTVGTTTTATATTNTATTATTTTIASYSNNSEDTERGTRLLADNHSVPVEKTSDDVIVERVSKTKNKTKTKTKNVSTSEHPPATIDTEDDDDDDYYSEEPEDEMIVQFLGEANRIAEARLTARRQARTEAREIRMKELERQQKHQDHNADRDFDMQTTPALDPLSRVGNANVNGLLNSGKSNSMSSQRSSVDSLEDEGRSYLRDNKQELKDAEERFRKAMIANAQLDNERASQTYQIQHLKDQLEEIEELNAQLQREIKDKTRDCNAFKRNLDKVNEELKLVHGQLNERDALIVDQGLVIVAVENDDGSDAKRALISTENAQLLSSVQGSLDVRLKRFNEEKQQLKDEIQRLKQQLESHKSKNNEQNNNKVSEQLDEETEAQREANKIICDYKFRLQKAEQDISSLQASLARSETQLVRYKTAVEAAEKAEAELKGDKRKLQRENRETAELLEEQETANKHLMKRLDKIKNAKSALLKDL